jgi:hypothetical protein
MYADRNKADRHETGPDGREVETEITFKRFVFRRNWFMLSQTDGAPCQFSSTQQVLTD